MITPIVLTARYVTGDNQPCVGQLVIALRSPLRDTANGVIVNRTKVYGPIVDGSLSLSLDATDDVDLEAPSSYDVIEEIIGALANKLVVSVPHASPGGTVDLSSLS